MERQIHTDRPRPVVRPSMRLIYGNVYSRDGRTTSPRNGSTSSVESNFLGPWTRLAFFILQMFSLSQSLRYYYDRYYLI